jgi:6-phosphogluconolactonase
LEQLREILADKTALVTRATELVIAEIEQALRTRGVCTLVLAGGSTPKPLYEAIAQQDLPWECLQIFWGDERYVSPDHPDSNAGMARRAWLDKVPFPAANIHPMPTGAANPAQDAQSYEQELQQWFSLGRGEFPRFDLILLGMGDDGHTASLFPHTAALGVSDRLITVGNKDGEPRLTMTVPLINHARCVLFLVAGAAKRPALAQVFAPTGDEQAYPSRLIRPQGKLIWLLDYDAGAELQP